jgi:hypothetical protein
MKVDTKRAAVVSLGVLLGVLVLILGGAGASAAALDPAATAATSAAAPSQAAAPAVSWLTFIPTGYCHTLCASGSSFMEEIQESTLSMCCSAGNDPCPAGWTPRSSAFYPYHGAAVLCGPN